MKQLMMWMAVVVLVLSFSSVATAQGKEVAPVVPVTLDTTLSLDNLGKVLADRKGALVKQKEIAQGQIKEMDDEILRIEGQLVLLNSMVADSLKIKVNK